MKSLSFNFESPSEKDKAVKELVKLFASEKAKAIDVKVDRKTSRKAGIEYRNVALTFDDSQRITMGFTSTGDVFEARVNGRMLPISNQDDTAEAVKELAAYMASKRQSFQRSMQRIKLPNPPGIRTSKLSQLQAKIEKRDALVEVVASKEQELAALVG